ncbi:MAG: Digeranylgeranylglyceryl phosphate synthase [Candidatus Nomurabacteria bacterium GW2011_GWB1_40_7]|uniref:Digeranylgeranylglyceryl phosphate synthase n=1 Tax=Candidatus Nomurabacteria bacterium GW2011_GWB1_40_7 TaxID=1618744 RepID=A0A0G0SYW8_9BACT|nr:MAG: Digeranylgeranylglyceryl phosphate synthase [Candidatus Nomurabacteria bacterium GW2011_GWB1_40_7]
MIIRNFIEKLENSKLSFWGGVFLLFTMMFFRTFLENFTNSSNLYHLSGIIDTFFHYPFWFLILFLSIFIIARILTKEKIEKIAKVVTFFSFALLIPPIIDLIISKGQIPYSFIVGNSSQLFKLFFTYLGSNAIGIGIRIEIIITLIGLGFYIFYKTKEIKRAIVGIIVLYSVIFIMGVFPAFVFGVQNAITKQYQTMEKSTVVDFYFHKEPLNAVTANRTFVLDAVTDKDFYPLPQQKIINQYSLTLSIIFLLINVVLLGWCLFLYSSRKFFAVLKNFRYLRIIHYFLMLSVGIYLGINILGKNPIGSLFDLLSFLSLFLALLFAWLFTVWENDEVDIEIDKISNQSRPLAQIESIVSPEEWQNLKFIFLVLALLFAFLCGLYTFIFILLSLFVAHIYSAPPLRLKRFLGISSLLYAIPNLLVVWMGFFMTAGTENLSAFPTKYSLGILGIIFLVENGKNIKDIEGDKKEGIKTLPVVFGEKMGKLLTGFCLFLGALLVPFIFYFNLYTFLTAIIFGIIFFLLTIKKNYKEKYLVFSEIIYIITFFVLMNL